MLYGTGGKAARISETPHGQWEYGQHSTVQEGLRKIKWLSTLRYVKAQRV